MATLHNFTKLICSNGILYQTTSTIGNLPGYFSSRERRLSMTANIFKVHNIIGDCISLRVQILEGRCIKLSISRKQANKNSEISTGILDETSLGSVVDPLTSSCLDNLSESASTDLVHQQLITCDYRLTLDRGSTIDSFTHSNAVSLSTGHCTEDCLKGFDLVVRCILTVCYLILT